MSDRIERGLKIFSELLGPQAEAAMRGAIDHPEEFGSAIASIAAGTAFADIWGRDGLERKQRSLVTLGILIASRQTLELKNHVRIAIRNGLTASELQEVLIHSIAYVGFPAVASATTAMLETLREMGIDTKTRTSEERGLL
jgi:4-carboxymuconolactone decarboxylase